MPPSCSTANCMKSPCAQILAGPFGQGALGWSGRHVVCMWEKPCVLRDRTSACQGAQQHRVSAHAPRAFHAHKRMSEH
jgi:hypothetical protein